MTWTVHEGDCVDVMRGMPARSVDSVVCDPPYGLGFMGKSWDSTAALASRPPSADETDARFNNAFPRTGKGPAAVAFDGRGFQAWCEAWAREALRVLKPGGHMIAAGGSRTYHRLTCGLEDAGFEIRDCLAWLYGQGFPKSHNLAGEWEGWGTALKPAHEPIVLARKPLAGTVAGNVLAHGTGALNVDGCRIEGDVPRTVQGQSARAGEVYGRDQRDQREFIPASGGRWPANVVLDPEAAAFLDQQTGREVFGYGDSGGASRFFYVSKASSAERNAGLDGFEEKAAGNFEDDAYVWATDGRGIPRAAPIAKRNPHPTVKPIALMRWLCRLVTPPGGTILDPFAGSGTTGIAAGLEGFDFIGIEQDPEYARIMRARLAWWVEHPDGMDLVRRLELEEARKTVAASGQLDMFTALEDE